MADPVTSNTATVVVQAVDKDKTNNNIVLLIILYFNTVLNTVNHFEFYYITVCDAQLLQRLHLGKCGHGPLDDCVRLAVFDEIVEWSHSFSL